MQGERDGAGGSKWEGLGGSFQTASSADDSQPKDNINLNCIQFRNEEGFTFGCSSGAAEGPRADSNFLLKHSGYPLLIPGLSVHH